MTTTLTVNEVAKGALGGASVSTETTVEHIARHPLFSARQLNVMRALGERYAVVVRLNATGARAVMAESGHVHHADDEVVLYTVAEDAAEVREEFADWGEIMAMEPLSNIRSPREAQ